MSNSKKMNRICAAFTAVMLLVSGALLLGGKSFLASADTMPLYEKKLFSDEDQVHQIEITAKEGDWEEMLQNAMAEEYIPCDVEIDGEQWTHAAIRPKGNTSLSTVEASGSDRYSLKIEFDHYEEGQSCYGLDKLCLNNLIQDNTCLKDFAAYQMMNSIGAYAPLCSYAFLTVNGEPWGLYLAVEAVEESFCERVYGEDYGSLYKPDSMDMGAGRGAQAGKGGDPMSGTASQDLTLSYLDDSPESYPDLFDSAVFSIDTKDEKRLINVLKQLSAGDTESSLDREEVLRYFAAHNFLLNEDSYTGNLLHNYYLHEENGKLSMIAWDYNLAFGGMSMGGKGQDAESLINSPIDSPVSGGSLEERPMISWIFSQEESLEEYHRVLKEWIESYFESGYFETMLRKVTAAIAPYVKQDPTAFCTYEEFEKGSETLLEFCLKRAESVLGQLKGEIPSTEEGQKEDSSSFVDAGDLVISDMGGMTSGFQGNFPGNPGASQEKGADGSQKFPGMGEQGEGQPGEPPQGDMQPPEGFPEGFDGVLPQRPGENGAETPAQEETPSQPDAQKEAQGNRETSESSDSGSQENNTSSELPESGEGALPGGFPKGGDFPAGNGFPGGNAPGGNGFSPQGEAAQAERGLNTWLLLGGSCLLLALGILFAKRYG